MNPLPPDPYKVLGIAPDAQLPDIRAAHRKLVKLCHPDKVAADASDDERKEKEDEFKRVQKAYELLSDENERRKYDDKVKLHKRYQDIRRAAAGAGAFSSAVPRWEGGSPTVHVNIRTAEPRPDTFASKSPPRDGPEPYHRSPKPSPEQARPERPKPNIGLKHTNEARHARRSPSYESHPSPTEESEAGARQRAMDEKEKELARRERKLKEAEKALKTEKRPTEKPSRSKEERANRKSKETYIEEPQKGTEEVYLSKSAKVKSSSKPHKSHRSSKHERSRSRSASRPVEKPVKKKESMGKTRLRGEVEEAEDTDTGVESGVDDSTRKMKSAMNTAINYIGVSSKLKTSKTFHGGDFPPSAPTPPPTAAPGHPPPPPTDRVVPNIVNAEPRLVPQPPKLNRSTTAPQPTTYVRAIPISNPGEPQYGSPNNGRLRTSHLAQNFFPDDEDVPLDEMRGSRSRRGSSTAYSAQPHSYSRQHTYPAVAEEYYQASAQVPYYAGASSHSPKHHVMPGVRHVHSSAAPAPFRTVQTSPAYDYDDVNYSQIPRGYSPGMAFS